MRTTFDCKQTLCSSLYLLPLQIWIIMMQMCKFIQPNTQKFIVFALKANTSKLHAKVLFWSPGKKGKTPVQLTVFAIFLPKFEVH